MRTDVSGVPGHVFGIARDIGQVAKEGHVTLQVPTTCHVVSKGTGVERRHMRPKMVSIKSNEMNCP